MDPSTEATPIHDERHQKRRRQAADTITQPAPPPTPARSNLGPLTTTFVPPSHCSQALLACQTCTSAWRAQSCIAGGAGDDTNCWPSATFYPRRAPLAGLGFYSPGIVCPTGHTSACGVVAQSADVNAAVTGILQPGPMADGRFQFPMLEGETAVGCCPTGYDCTLYTQFGWQTCHMAVTSTSFAAMTCNGVSEVGMTTSLPWAVGVVTVSSMDLWAPLVQINWQSTDIERAALSRPTSTTSSVALSSRTVEMTATATASTGSSTPTPIPTRLSTAAIAGITVAATIIFLLLLSLLVYICLRRRHNQRIDSNSKPDDRYCFNKDHAIAAFSLPVTPSELLSNYIPQELHQAHGPFYELGGGEGRDTMVKAEGGQIKFDTQAARFGRGLGVEDDLESPVDGSSPFRLKRGDTLTRGRMRDVRVSGHKNSKLEGSSVYEYRED
ncbi:hypothetical protein BDV96DRAFT_599938 [Lophiotrema nucula]|uniref:Uncharacterized protein n=1 Tax=Lophiotrema nucula TaxID=690887 RepID=A0A6A5Z6G8_9PLEO|nr:hypothetical protein BDV96DRAFT_599938 [Lophiotrema nucula]